MTEAEIKDAIDGLALHGAPQLALDAARVLFASGWSLNEFGLLCHLIATRAQVFDNQKDAERMLIEDAMREKPQRTN